MVKVSSMLQSPSKYLFSIEIEISATVLVSLLSFAKLNYYTSDLISLRNHVIDKGLVMKKSCEY